MSIIVENEGITVRRADADDRESWDDYVERSPHGTAFHRLDALDVQANHAGATVHPLVGRKGQETVGVFPVFTVTKAGMTTAFSPPPNLHVPYLGPALLNFEKLKSRKAERRNARFVDGCLDWLDRQVSPKYTHVRTVSGYEDVRPFDWQGFDVTPRYTYAVDLTPGEEEVMMNFSSDARNNVRGADDDRYDIYEGGTDAVERIVAQVKRRHDEQGESYSLDAAFLADLKRRLPEGTVRPYVCTVDGSFAGGIVAVDDGTAVYRWQGGVKTDGDLPVNDLLDWRIMRDAIDRGRERYDLVGANNRRICGYKSKYGPDLRQYRSLETGTRAMTALSNVYKWIR